MSVGIILGLLAFAIAVTAVTGWLFRCLESPPAGPFAALGAHLLWVALLFAAGLIATRYIERTANALIGYLLFGLAALGLSLFRAWLYRRASGQPAVNLWPLLLHTLAYGLFALVVYLLLTLIGRGSADPCLFIPLFVGALLPDLDSSTSLPGRLLPFLSRWLERRFGHRGAWHTPAAALAVAAGSAPLIPLLRPEGWGLVSLGFLCHLGLDLLSPQGVMLLWPLKHTRYYLFSFLQAPGCPAERRFVVALATVVALLLLVVDLGPAPQPSAPPPSYEQSLERFHSLQGRNLAFADVEGTWQATGRRVAARFEVLNALGPSFILLDRYSGTVFSAGRGAADNFYLDRIAVVAGAPAQIRPVELHLQDETLAGALPILYQMQQEPGLQYIFVSGDVTLSAGQGRVLPVDYAQTRLRKVEALEAGHYRLHYLTAAEVIALANLRVEAADLVIVATYTRPASGPTATPLPSPPPTAEAKP